MERLTSKRLVLPTVYFISDKKEIASLPPGVPYIFGDESTKQHIIRALEYEIIYQSALKTGLPFNWEKLLNENGYEDIFKYDHGDSDPDAKIRIFCDGETELTLSHFIKDRSVLVDIETLNRLKVTPVWLTDIEKAIVCNIHNMVQYNPYMYHKALDGFYGGMVTTSAKRNLIIVDISGSIPRAASAMQLVFVKNYAVSFYCDILITGSKSTLYSYEQLSSLDLEKIYTENEIDNDQVYFLKLVSNYKEYETVIVFGDFDQPGMQWSNKYNKKTKIISEIEGKELCKWKINKLISFHTKSNSSIAGYGLWFTPKEVTCISNWITYLE
jgi:hypothetical protein